MLTALIVSNLFWVFVLIAYRMKRIKLRASLCRQSHGRAVFWDEKKGEVFMDKTNGVFMGIITGVSDDGLVTVSTQPSK